VTKKGTTMTNLKEYLLLITKITTDLNISEDELRIRVSAVIGDMIPYTEPNLDTPRLDYLIVKEAFVGVTGNGCYAVHSLVAEEEFETLGPEAPTPRQAIDAALAKMSRGEHK